MATTAHAVEADTAVKVTRRHRGRQARRSPPPTPWSRNPLIDVVIDATGKPGVAADFDLLAMEHGKHLVMMNVEADVTIGRYLKKQADRLGVIYSVGAGDEPSSCMELIEFAYRAGLPHRLRRQGQEQRRSTTTPSPTTIARKPPAGT